MRKEAVCPLLTGPTNLKKSALRLGPVTCNHHWHNQLRRLEGASAGSHCTHQPGRPGRFGPHGRGGFNGDALPVVVAKARSAAVPVYRRWEMYRFLLGHGQIPRGRPADEGQDCRAVKRGQVLASVPGLPEGACRSRCAGGKSAQQQAHPSSVCHPGRQRTCRGRRDLLLRRRHADRLDGSLSAR